MKKPLIIIMIVLLLVSLVLLSACNDNVQETGSDEGGEPETPQGLIMTQVEDDFIDEDEQGVDIGEMV